MPGTKPQTRYFSKHRKPPKPRCYCPNCRLQGKQGEGCPYCPGFWYAQYGRA